MKMRSSAITPSPRFERNWSVGSAESVERKTSSLKRDDDGSPVELGLGPVSPSSPLFSLQLNRKKQPVRMDSQVEEGQPTPSIPRQAVTDDEGNTVTLTLDIKSVKPYRTQDEYLYAMKEDLAEWFNALYDLPITVDDFFEQLETGVILCQHANALQNFIARQLVDEKRTNAGVPVSGLRSNNNRYPVQLPSSPVVFRSRVQPGSFQSRDNISNFICWCRQVLGIPDTLLFETEDIVSRKNERNVVLCVLEVARRGASYGMLAPKLVQFEAEIEAEMAKDEEDERQEGEGNDGAKQDGNQNRHQQPTSQAAASRKQKPWIEVDMMSLDEMVRLILSACTCEHQFPMIRISEGKYRFGDSLSLIFLRILRNHVMVRIGGGWDTLECFLDRYDPCRCKSKEHRGTLAFATKPSSIHATEQQKPPVSSPFSQGIISCSSQHSATETISTTQSPWTKGSPQKHPSKERLQPEKPGGPVSQQQQPPPLKPKPSSPMHISKRPDSRPDSRTGQVSRRTTSPVSSPAGGDSQPRRIQCSQANRLNEPMKPSVTKRLDTRPSSASPSLAQVNKTFRSSSDLLSSNGSRGYSPARGQSANNRQALVRTSSTSTSNTKSGGVAERMTPSRSVTPSGSVRRSNSMDSTKLGSPLKEQKPKPATAVSATGQRPLSATARTKSSPNVILSKSDADKRQATRHNGQLTRISSHSSGNLTQKLSGARLEITADKLLPSYGRKWRGGCRSASVDVSPTDETRVLPDTEDDNEKPPSRMRRSASLQPSVSFTLLHIDDYPEPAPPEDEDLNARMELLYEQYRDVELGLIFTVGDSTAKDQSDKKSVSGSGSIKKNSATPSSSSKVIQGRCPSRERVGPKTSPSRSLSRREAAEKDGKQRSLRSICPSAEIPSGEKPSRSSNRPASSSLKDQGRRMVMRKESASWSADQTQQTTRVPSADHRPRLSFDASTGTTGDVRPRSSSRPGSLVSKERALSGSRESIVLDRSLKRRNRVEGLCKSLDDICDNRLTLQRPLNATPAQRTSRMDNTCSDGAPVQVPLNRRKESGDADSLQITLDLAALGDSVKAKLRKDDRLGPPTRIPLPVVSGDQQRSDHSAGLLKRFDSGVDITNISPTGENGSLQGDEDGSCRGWTISVQCTEACSLSDQKLVFTAPPQVEEEFY